MDYSLIYPLHTSQDSQYHAVEYHVYQPLPPATLLPLPPVQIALETQPVPDPHPPSPTTPRRGSHGPDHIPRPRNAFLIFRSEYFRTKLTRTVEHDHRQISRIIAHCWHSLSPEERVVYQNRADEEKAEHKRKYPNYKYAPSPRSKPITRRNVKRNGIEDLERCEKIADLLLAGKAGAELEIAVKAMDQPEPEEPDEPGPSARNPFSYANRDSDVPAFRNPLLPPPKTPPRSLSTLDPSRTRPPFDDLRQPHSPPYPVTPTKTRHHRSQTDFVISTPESFDSAHYHPYSPVWRERQGSQNSGSGPPYTPSPSSRSSSHSQWGASETDRYSSPYQELALLSQSSPPHFSWSNAAYSPAGGASTSRDLASDDIPTFSNPFDNPGPFSGRRPSAPVDPLDRSPLARSRR